MAVCNNISMKNVIGTLNQLNCHPVVKLSFTCHSMVSFFMLLIVFLLKPKVLKGEKFSAFAMFYVICIYLLPVKWLYKIFLILLSGDVEINPGPRRSTDETFSICLWKLNSLLAYN